MRVYTLSNMQSEKKLRVYTASEAKGLTSSRREYYVFQVPRKGLYSVKNQKNILAIINFKSGHPNKPLFH